MESWKDCRRPAAESIFNICIFLMGGPPFVFIGKPRYELCILNTVRPRIQVIFIVSGVNCMCSNQLTVKICFGKAEITLVPLSFSQSLPMSMSTPHQLPLNIPLLLPFTPTILLTHLFS